jgi:hypothetical protein
VDYFEEVACKILEEDGYWIRRSFKVDLTKNEKARIGKPSTPRPEIDILAFDYKRNLVILVEAKSYLDSLGVKYESISACHDISEGRYKLFTCKSYREVVIARLREQLIGLGMAKSGTTFTLGLVAGRVQQSKDSEIEALFKENGWVFWSPAEVRERVAGLATIGYENHPAVITAKILLRT